MLKQITKEDVLAAWLIKLRNPNTKQCVWGKNSIKYKSSGHRCALAHLYYCIPEYITESVQFNLAAAAEYVGLNSKQYWKIIDANDGRGDARHKTLPEIADMVEDMLKT